MPIYEFVCEKCGYEFEQIQTFSATIMPSCASCQSEHVTRRMSRPAIHFKGSGWYITDSKKNGKSAANGENKSSEKKETESSDSTTKESSKPEGEKSESSKLESAKSDSGKSEASKSESSTSATSATAA